MCPLRKLAAPFRIARMTLAFWRDPGLRYTLRRAFTKARAHA